MKRSIDTISQTEGDSVRIAWFRCSVFLTQPARPAKGRRRADPPLRRRQKPNDWAPCGLVGTLMVSCVLERVAEYLHPLSMVALSRTCRALHSHVGCRLDGLIAQFVRDWRLASGIVDRPEYERSAQIPARDLTHGWKVLPCITPRCRWHGVRSEHWQCGDCVRWREVMGSDTVDAVNALVRVRYGSPVAPWETAFAGEYVATINRIHKTRGSDVGTMTHVGVALYLSQGHFLRPSLALALGVACRAIREIGLKHSSNETRSAIVAMSIVCNGEIECSCSRSFDGADGCSFAVPWSTADRIRATKLVLECRRVYVCVNPMSAESFLVAIISRIPDLIYMVGTMARYVGDNVYVDNIRRDAPRRAVQRPEGARVSVTQ
jgi:hypothetical protein